MNKLIKKILYIVVLGSLILAPVNSKNVFAETTTNKVFKVGMKNVYVPGIASKGSMVTEVKSAEINGKHNNENIILITNKKDGFGKAIILIQDSKSLKILKVISSKNYFDLGGLGENSQIDISTIGDFNGDGINDIAVYANNGGSHGMGQSLNIFSFKNNKLIRILHEVPEGSKTKLYGSPKLSELSKVYHKKFKVQSSSLKKYYIVVRDGSSDIGPSSWGIWTTKIVGSKQYGILISSVDEGVQYLETYKYNAKKKIWQIIGLDINSANPSIHVKVVK